MNKIWLLENTNFDDDDNARIIWSPDADCERIHEGYKIIGEYTRANLPTHVLPPQEPLGAEFGKVLDDNLSELLVRWGGDAPTHDTNPPSLYKSDKAEGWNE